MDDAVSHDSVLTEVMLFLKETGMSQTHFGKCAINDGMLVLDLRNGRECRSSTRKRILAYIKNAKEQGWGG